MQGPIPAPMERRAGRYRAQLLIEAPERRPLQRLLRTLVPALVRGWIEWASALVAGAPRQRRAEAESAIALLDGLLLLRQLAGAEAANRAARRLGVR